MSDTTSEEAIFDEPIQTELSPIEEAINEQFIGHDSINSPQHYRHLPNGIEAIDVSEHFSGNIAQVIQYVIRHKHKGSPIEDLEKARWFITREIQRIKKYGI